MDFAEYQLTLEHDDDGSISVVLKINDEVIYDGGREVSAEDAFMKAGRDIDRAMRGEPTQAEERAAQEEAAQWLLEQEREDLRAAERISISQDDVANASDVIRKATEAESAALDAADDDG